MATSLYARLIVALNGVLCSADMMRDSSCDIGDDTDGVSVLLVFLSSSTVGLLCLQASSAFLEVLMHRANDVLCMAEQDLGSN